MFKIGVVGAGHLGKIHLKILKDAPFVNLVGFSIATLRLGKVLSLA